MNNKPEDNFNLLWKKIVKSEMYKLMSDLRQQERKEIYRRKREELNDERR